MASLETFKIALSMRDVPSRAEWQAIIEQRRLLFSFQLREIELGADGPCSALIDGQPVTFACERQGKDVALQHHPRLLQDWRFAYGFRGTGDLISSAVSGLAWLTYAWGTEGVLYHPDHGTFEQWDLQQQSLEGILAVSLGKMAVYRDRYPWKDEDYPTGPGTVSSHIDPSWKPAR